MRNGNSLILFCLIFFLFNACKKDRQLELEQQVNENIETTHHDHRSCGMQSHMDRLLKDPENRRKHEEKLRAVRNMVNSRSECDSPIILPVAVHYQGVSNPDLACLRDLAERSVASLNADYQGANTDITNWTNGAASSFPGVSNGEACFEFCLASQNHPASSGLDDGSPAVTVNEISGDFSADWAGYINIFVIPNTGLLGYAPLGGSGNGDGVVVDAAAFGIGSGCGAVGPQAPFDLGRTLTHEMGHYLLLDHIWGDGCSVDDEVADTPDAAQEYYECPNVGESSCGSTDMHMNYMDYTNDACMYMFTSGQVARSANYIQSSLQAVVNNAASVCGGGGGTPPTCSDGIQNGQETGVDCGGPDCAPCDTGSTCETPQNLQSTAVTENSADLSWNMVAGAVEYVLQFRTTGQNNWYTLYTNTATATLSALAAETTYEWQVQAICQDGQSDFSTTATFTTLEHGCPEEEECTENALALNLILDDYGSETTWVIYDEDRNVVAEGGAYEDGLAGEEILEALCLPDGCYSFNLYDAANDGMCCDYGEGGFSLMNPEGLAVLSSDGVFGGFIGASFCVQQTQGRVKVSNIQETVSLRDINMVRAAAAAKQQSRN